MAFRDIVDDNDEFRDIEQYADEGGYPYTYPFYYSDCVAPRDLSGVTVGVLNEFPYTFPFDLSVEGLRWLIDPEA